MKFGGNLYGIIHLVPTQNVPKKKPYVCASGGKKC